MRGALKYSRQRKHYSVFMNLKEYEQVPSTRDELENGMKRFLIALVLMTSVALPMSADAGIVRDAGRSCVFGAALLATTTYLGLTPTLLATGTLTLPFAVQSVTASNAIVGCGVTAAAATAASLFTSLYDAIF